VNAYHTSIAQSHTKQWRNWQGVRERAAPTGKLNVKTGPPLAEIFIFIIILVFSWLLFFFSIFQGVFIFLTSLNIHDIWIHYFKKTIHYFQKNTISNKHYFKKTQKTKNNISKKLTSKKSLHVNPAPFHVNKGAVIFKSKHVGRHFGSGLQGDLEGSQRFFPDFMGFCPGFSPNQNFWWCDCTPASYTSACYCYAIKANSRKQRSHVS